MATMQRYFGYYYFATPDYEDCVPKTWVCLKMAGAWTVLMTGNHLLTGEGKLDMNGRLLVIPKTLEYTARTVIRFGAPAASIAFLGASTSCALANFRGKKDDPWNHMLSWGPAIGLVLTRTFQCSARGFAAGLFGGLFAGFAKLCDTEDYVFLAARPVAQKKFSCGPYGGDDWGDMRFGYQKYEDPGRRSNN